MKELSIKVMGEREHEISELLQSLELSKIVSRTVACLANTDEMTSRQIEAAAGIRQPEVSAAMRVLRTKEWVVEREEKKKLGKGRPVKVYRLDATLREIVEALEEERISYNNKMVDDLVRLRELA
ncbi:MAG TPA: transcriptional regulator [Methanosarcinales archaeon]|nr:transcriptional regulator [Methanosarcinales archaeon]